MQFPNKIYKKFEIIEKKIYGETFYSVYQLKSFFGIEYKKLRRIRVNIFNENLGIFDVFGQRYVKLGAAKDAIDMERARVEHKFKRKVLK